MACPIVVGPRPYQDQLDCHPSKLTMQSAPAASSQATTQASRTEIKLTKYLYLPHSKVISESLNMYLLDTRL